MTYSAMSVAEAIIPFVTGPISVISSMTIIIMILRSKKALSIPYHRILFGLSVADVIASVSMSASSLPAPRDTLHLKYSYGNQPTCEAQGFLFLLGQVAEPLYQCSLQLYYLCMIKYGMKAEDIQRKLEPFLHCIPILYGMVAAIVSLVTESINASAAWCYIDSYPHGCRDDEDLECTRGKGIILKRIVFGATPLFFSFIFMSIAMIMIYRAVRQKEITVDGLRFRGSTPPLQTNEVKPRRSFIAAVRTSITKLSLRSSEQRPRNSGKILERIVQYYAAYLLANFFPLLANFISAFSERINVLFILQNIFFPLQGLYTLLVVVNPHYKKVRSSSEELSVFKAFAITIMSYGGAEYRRSSICVRIEFDDAYEENESDFSDSSDEIEGERNHIGVMRNSVVSLRPAHGIIDEEDLSGASKPDRIEEEFRPIQSD